MLVSLSFISSKDTSEFSSSVSSTADSGVEISSDVFFNSAKSSSETLIFSGTFLALFDGRIGTPDFEISPLYKFSKSSPISSSSSVLSSACSTFFLNL